MVKSNTPKNAFFTYEEIDYMFQMFASDEYCNRPDFVRELNKIGLERNLCTLIWQCFDRATENFYKGNEYLH
jgi:hypothetical protein